MNVSIRKSKKLSYKELIHLIAVENSVSEAAVSTTLQGLARLMLRELANGKVINLLNIGIFHTMERKVCVGNFTPDTPQQKRNTIFIKFRSATQFRHQLQILTGHRTANKDNRNVITNPIEAPQPYQDFTPIDNPDSTPQ